MYNMYVCMCVCMVMSVIISQQHPLIRRLQRGGDLQRVRSADSQHQQGRAVLPGRGQPATGGQQCTAAQFGGRFEQALQEKEKW